MFRKNFHEYLFSQQEQDDIYSKYRQQHRKIACEPLKNQAIANSIKDLIEKTLMDSM